MKPRIHTYVSDINFARLHEFAKRPGQSLCGVVDEALTQYLSGNKESEREAVIARRLDRLSRQFDRLEQKDTVLGETLALFIRYFLMVTPQLPAHHLDAARAKGEEQFEQFLEQLGRDLQSGTRSLQRAMNEATAEANDFFSEAELERLHQPAPKRPAEKEAGHA